MNISVLFVPCLKVTNTFVSPSWPGAWSNSYLVGVRACKSVGMAQETRDHSYFHTQSVMNKVHPKYFWSWSPVFLNARHLLPCWHVSLICY